MDPMQTLNECVNNLHKHENVMISLQIATETLETFPENINNDYDDYQPLRWTIIDHLVSNAKILTHLFNDIQHFKENIKNKSMKNENTNENKNQVESNIENDNYSKEMFDRINFLIYLVSNHKIDITIEQLELIWKLCIITGGNSQQSELSFTFINKSMKNYNPKKRNEITNIFYDKYILPYFTDIQNIKYIAIEGFNFFCDCFFTINGSKNTLSTYNYSTSTFTVLDYDNLIGINTLWNIIIYSQDEQVTQKSTSLYGKLTDNLSNKNKNKIKNIRTNTLQRVMNTLNDENSNDDIKLVLLKFIVNLLDETEKNGLKSLKSHKALIFGDKLKFKVIDRIAFNGFGVPPEFYIDNSLCEYNTLWDLKTEIMNKTSADVKCAERVKIYLKGKHLNLNTLTLNEYDICDGCIITCTLNNLKNLRVPLLTSEIPTKLVPKCIAALQRIWNNFAEHEVNGSKMMNYDNMRSYIIACGAGENSASRTRVQNIFSQYPDGSTDINLFAFEGFCRFYRTACIDRPDHVWNDLYVHGFKYDLTHTNDNINDEKEENNINEKEKEYESLCCWLISNNDEWFNILYDYCLQKSNNNEIVQLASQLVFRLPTNQTVKKYIFDNNNCVYNWNELLTTNNINLLLYAAFSLESEVFDKKEFLVNRKGFDFLFKILFMLNCDQCKDNISKEFKNFAIKRILKYIHAFVSKKISFNPIMSLILQQFSYFEQNEMIEFGINENKNNFMHFICLSSKYKQIEFYKDKIDEVEQITFYKDQILQPNILNIYVEPLVFGYVNQTHNECQLSKHVSMDILKILLSFFF